MKEDVIGSSWRNAEENSNLLVQQINTSRIIFKKKKPGLDSQFVLIHFVFVDEKPEKHPTKKQNCEFQNYLISSL